MILNGIQWKIFLVSPNHPALQEPNGLYTLGSCDNRTHCIYINDMLDFNYLWKVLCHEITHAAMFSYHVYLSDQQEELLADLMATYGSEIIIVTNRIFKKLTNYEF